MTFKLPGSVQDEEPIVANEPEVGLVEEPIEEPAKPNDDELVVDLSGETTDDDMTGPDGQKAPDWVKDVRKQNRLLQRELRELRQKQNEIGAQRQQVELGPEPTIETFEYDAGKYKTALSAWLEKKHIIDTETKSRQDADKVTEQRWQGKLAAYGHAKGALNVTDYADAEGIILDAFDTTQQGIIVSGAKDAALLVYALGKNPEQVKKLAAIKDPIEFTFAVARLEAQMKVNGKKPATQPEVRVTGNGKPSSVLDTQLERLRTEAVRTGNYTKINQYKARLKATNKH